MNYITGQPSDICHVIVDLCKAKGRTGQALNEMGRKSI